MDRRGARCDAGKDRCDCSAMSSAMGRRLPGAGGGSLMLLKLRIEPGNLSLMYLSPKIANWSCARSGRPFDGPGAGRAFPDDHQQEQRQRHAAVSGVARSGAQEWETLEQWWVEKGAENADAGRRPSRASRPEVFPAPLSSTGYANGEAAASRCLGWRLRISIGTRVGYVGNRIFRRAVEKLRLVLGPSRWDEKSYGLVAEMGFDPDPNFQTRLAPGETFEAAPVSSAATRGDVDDGCNHLRHWVDAHLRPADG